MKVTEQEIRDCKEGMSVSIDDLSVFYSFSPKIEKESISLRDLKEKVLNDTTLGLTLVEVLGITLCDNKEYISKVLREKNSAEKDKTEKLVFTTLEKELTSEKQQGHLSIRHKKPAPMYLDEVLADIAEKELKVRPIDTNFSRAPFQNYYDYQKQISQLGSATLNFPQKEIKEQSSSTEGVKHNKGKLPLDTMITKQFPNALEAICKATEYGHQKYLQSDLLYDNFKKVEGGSQTYADAGQRHNLHKNEIDEESGLPHIYLKCWNAMAELEVWIEEIKTK